MRRMNFFVTVVVVGVNDSRSGTTSEHPSVGRGAVQFMTAGTGVRHSEHNLDKTKPLRFIQMWLVPNRGGLKPNYGSHETTAECRADRWCHVVSPVAGAGPSGGVRSSTD